MICELCNIRAAEHSHHLFSQSKQNKELYKKYINHTLNIINLCSICHLNKSIPKLTELEFCKLLGIKPRSKELLQKISDGKVKIFWHEN